MTKIETLNKAYVTKLEETNSHDEAILHVAWLAYQDGVKSMGGEVTESHSRYFDDMLGNPMNDLSKLRITDLGAVAEGFKDGGVQVNYLQDDGWIEWNGGDMPVDGDLKVEVKLKNGYCDFDKAMYFRWAKWENDDDIIAYKVISSG